MSKVRLETSTLTGGLIPLPGFKWFNSRFAIWSLNHFYKHDSQFQKSFSLFTGQIHNYNYLSQRLNYPITSIDVAFMLDWKIIRSDVLFYLRTTGIKQAILALLFSLTCPRNQQQFERNILNALPLSSNLRVSSSFFKPPRKAQGDFILKLADTYPDLKLTLEQDATSHSWQEYLQLFSELKQNYPQKFSMSFDAGHFVESFEVREQSVPEITSELKKVIVDISTIEINTHTNTKTPIDYKQLVRISNGCKLIFEPKLAVFENLQSITALLP